MRTLSSLLRLPGLALALAGLAAPALATDVFVGGLHSVFARGDAAQGNFQVLGACGGAIQSLAVDAGGVLLGDATGNVYRYTAAQGFPTYAFTATNDAAALAVVGRDLYVGGTDGTIERRNTSTFALISTWDLQMPITALVVRGQMLYAGSSWGVVQRGDRTLGRFQFWGTCAFPVTAMTADATHLMMGSAQGILTRIAFDTGVVAGIFAVPGDHAALAMDGEHLLAAASDGTIHRVDRTTGAPLGSVSWDLPIRALSVDMPLLSFPYCYGVGCPCGNDDGTGGCRNSTGAGALLEARGDTSVTADAVVLEVTRLPVSTLGRLYMGPVSTQVPFGDGLQCVGGGGYGMFRFPVQAAEGFGVFAFGPGIAQHAESHFGPSGRLLAGATWHFEAWYRNALGPCGSGFNTTNAVAVTFTP